VTNEVYFMVPSGTGPEPKYEPYLMVPSTGVEPEVYLMNPIEKPEPPRVWHLITLITFNILQATSTYDYTNPANYIGGALIGTFPGYKFFKIVYSSGYYYRGAILNDYRTGVGFKTRIEIGGSDPGSYATPAEAIAGGNGSTVELAAGSDCSLYCGSYMSAPLPADRLGSVSFNIYGAHE
jgi:hypothetical protein